MAIHKITCFDSFEPGRLNRITAHCVHPFDSLFDGWQIIDAVGLAKCLASFLGGFARLPLSLLLDEWDAISTIVVPNADEDGFAVACDEYVLLFVNRHTIFGENRDCAVV